MQDLYCKGLLFLQRVGYYPSKTIKIANYFYLDKFEKVLTIVYTIVWWWIYGLIHRPKSKISEILKKLKSQHS
jgi:hypothetical protein